MLCFSLSQGDKIESFGTIARTILKIIPMCSLTLLNDALCVSECKCVFRIQGFSALLQGVFKELKYTKHLMFCSTFIFLLAFFFFFICQICFVFPHPFNHRQKRRSVCHLVIPRPRYLQPYHNGQGNFLDFYQCNSLTTVCIQKIERIFKLLP